MRTRGPAAKVAHHNVAPVVTSRGRPTTKLYAESLRRKFNGGNTISPRPAAQVEGNGVLSPKMRFATKLPATK
jgi:hypothetical protein